MGRAPFELASASVAPRELHIAIVSSPKSLDPLLEGTVTDQSLAALAFDFLLEQRPDGTLHPSLAMSEPTPANGGISRDGKRVAFHLRRGVKWQDGMPFTSADVAFTARAILDPTIPIATREGFDDIASVETPDPLTVVFILKRVYAPFVTTISTLYPIVPAHLLAHSANIMEDPFGANPIGTGPYRFVRQLHGDRIEYEANPRYWGAKPKIDRVAVFEIPNETTMALALQTGQLDFIITGGSRYLQLRKDPRLVTGVVQANRFAGFALNVTRAPLDDVRVRRAVSMAIDRVRIAHDSSSGTAPPAYADLPAFLWQSPEPRNPYAYDVPKARKLLDAAGWHPGKGGTRVKDGKPLHLVFITMTGSAALDTEMLEAQSMLAAVGIDSELKSFSPSLYYAPGDGPWARGDFDLAIDANNSGPDPDDSDIFSCASREPNGFNAARYCTPEMDALQRASLQQPDPVKRRPLVARIEELAVSDVPYVFIANPPIEFAKVRSLRNATPSAQYDFYRVEDWSFST